MQSYFPSLLMVAEFERSVTHRSLLRSSFLSLPMVVELEISGQRRSLLRSSLSLPMVLGHEVSRQSRNLLGSYFFPLLMLFKLKMFVLSQSLLRNSSFIQFMMLAHELLFFIQ